MDNQEIERYMTEQRGDTPHLEPRVARLEVGLETLTRNVSEMATSIRENANNTNQKIDGLIVAVTTAQAPKKTDWGLFISGIGLLLALGAAVLIPLNNSIRDNKDQIDRYHESMVEHQKLDMHPVGLAKVQSLMKDVDMTKAELVSRDSALDQKIQRETQLMTDVVNAKISGLDEKVQLEMRLQNEITKLQSTSQLGMQTLFNEKIFARVISIEALEIARNSKDMDELRQWRNKANGLSTPASVVPLIPTQLPVVPSLK